MNRQFKCHVKEIDDKIDTLVNEHFANKEGEILREIFTAVAKLGLESQERGDLRLLNYNIKELRYAFGLFSKYKDIQKVAIFGSSRVETDKAQYQLAEKFSRKITQRGFMVITGAAGGIMEAGNKGAGLENSFGINIRLPFEQLANKYISGPRLINFKYFFTRKLIFQKESDATVLLPGGFGTIDEGMEILTLVQTGKSNPRPIILLQPPGDEYWSEFSDFIKKYMLLNGYISREDLSLFRVVNDADKAVEEITNFYKVYHSIRYIKDITVLRFKKPIPEEVIQEINSKFSDIMMRGNKATPCSPMEDEVKDNDYLNLPRLKFHFNRRNYGRLIELIRFINQEVSE